MAIREVETSQDAQAIMPQVNRLYNSLTDFKVNSTGSWLEAGEKIKIAKDKIREIRAVRKEFLDPINELKEKTLGFFEPALTKLEMVVNLLGDKMAVWRNEQLEKEEESRRKAEAEAREKERVERERLRKEAEDKAKAAEEARLKAEQAEREGNTLKAQIMVDKAESLKEEAIEAKNGAKDVEITAKEVKSKVQVVEGLSFRRLWKFEVVSASRVPSEFCRPDEVAIGKYVRDNKENARIPGVRVYFEDIPIG